MISLVLPTQKRLQELLDYNPLTGIFIWKKTQRKGHAAGGYKSKDGHMRIRVDGNLYLAHRLAWMYIYGQDPGEMTIDHKNRNAADNRISNLRLANLLTNQPQNKKVSGIHFVSKLSKWMARVQFKGKRFYLGLFETEAEAREAYVQKKRELCGEFSPC